MNRTTEQFAAENNDLIRNFLQAENTREFEAALAALFENVIVPAIKSILKRKMNVTLSADDLSARNLDAQELLSDAEAELLKRFRALRDRKTSEPIANPEAYARAVATNIFHQYLRDKYPQRRRLRNKLRYIFNNKDGYALWTIHDGSYVCGTEDWKRANKPPVELEPDKRILDPIESPGSGFGDLDDNRRILRLLKDILRIAGGPIGLNQIVGIVGEVLGLDDPIETEISHDIAFTGRDVEEKMIDRLSLESFWQAIVQMPKRHRTALLLNLRGDHGENILAFLPILGVASIRKIAEVLEIDVEELAKLWNDLPLDDNKIASMLGLTRQQVINLRQSAPANLKRKRLENK